MSIRVITAPDPFVVPADIPGVTDPNDPLVKVLIAACIGEIDGYTGTLGRCLAPQLLEWAVDRWPVGDSFSVPIGPLLEIEAVDYIDPAGQVQEWTAPEPLYFSNMPPIRGRRGDIRIRYWAGYGHRNPDDATRWIAAVPPQAKQAVIISVLHLKSLTAENLFLRSEEVEGVGTTTYTVSEQAGNVIREAAKRLLAGLKVRRL